MEKKISDETTRLSILKAILNYDNEKNTSVGVESMDDAALVKISETESMVIASDFIRGSGFYLFELGYLNYFDVGYYLIAANLSDIAAMGAKPYGLTTVIRYTKDLNDLDFTQIFLGMKAAADKFNTQIIGGDIGGHSSDVFTATAFGFMKTENVLLRKNVHEGDLLCIAGDTGLPITALTYFKEVKGKKDFSLTEFEEEKILNSWKRPTPRIAEGILLSENKIANSCQDVSDGLKATIEQVAELSGKTFTIYADKLPIDNATKKLASFLNIDFVQIAISASVDFALMFTMPKNKKELCDELFKRDNLSYSIIGEVNNEGKNIFVDSMGIPKELPGVAWKQQEGSEYLKQILKKS